MEKYCGNCTFYIPNEDCETYDYIEAYCIEDREYPFVEVNGDFEPCEKYCR